MGHLRKFLKLQWVLFTTVALCVAQLQVEAANSRKGNSEEIPRFETKVADIKCELTGSCPTNCSNAKRQQELPTPDTNLELTSNTAPEPNAAAHDRINVCNKQAKVNRVYRAHPGVRFLVAKIIDQGPPNKSGRTNRSLKKGFAGPDSDDSKTSSWFRHNPDVKSHRESDDLLDFGKKKEQVYFKTL